MAAVVQVDEEISVEMVIDVMGSIAPAVDPSTWFIPLEWRESVLKMIRLYFMKS